MRTVKSTTTQLTLTAAIAFCGVCTLSYGQMKPGPGGISTSNFVLWLNADAAVYKKSGTIVATNGNRVARWEDQSGAGNHVGQTASYMRPKFIDGAINGKPLLRFSTDFMTSATFPMATKNYYSVFSVFDYSASYSCDQPFMSMNSNANAGQIELGSTQRGSKPPKHSITGAGSARTAFENTTSYQSAKRVNSVSRSVQGGVHRVLCNRDGSSIYDNTLNGGSGVSNAFDQFKVGSSVDDIHRFTGDVAEILIYHRNIIDAERIIVENYLGAKYGIALNTNDYYAGDDPAMGDFDIDVVGVGKGDQGSNIYANSAGFELRQRGGFDVGDYFLTGHRSVGNSELTTDIAGVNNLNARWERVWYVDKTDAATMAKIDITFDYSDGAMPGSPCDEAEDHVLLFRPNIGDDWMIAAYGDLINGDRVTFLEASLQEGSGYYTMGTLDPLFVALPVELIGFEATNDAPAVKLAWVTASESNNAYFEVQRSANGHDFEAVVQVKGAGTSTTTLNYSAYDYNPNQGVSYYRLRQTDNDEQTTYSEVVAVDLKLAAPEVNIYPNPNSGDSFSMDVKGLAKNEGEVVVEIYNSVGELVYSRKLAASNGQLQASIEIKNMLRPGLYFLAANNERELFRETFYVR